MTATYTQHHHVYHGVMSQDVDKSDSQMKHVIAALVTNEPGVLARVAGMFAARGFNIDSLVVGRTENRELSRMTIVVVGDDMVLEQVRKQLQKLVPVVKVVDYKEAPYVERDLVLVQVSTHGQASPQSSSQDAGEEVDRDDDRGPSRGGASRGGMAQVSDQVHAADNRQEIITLVNLFRAKVVDVSAERLMIELAGTEEKLEAFIDLLAPFGILELARTGVIAMPRGQAAPLDRDTDELAADSIDPGDLPPG